MSGFLQIEFRTKPGESVLSWDGFILPDTFSQGDKPEIIAVNDSLPFCHNDSNGSYDDGRE